MGDGVLSHAEAKCARAAGVGLPERSEPEGPQGAESAEEKLTTKANVQARPECQHASDGRKQGFVVLYAKSRTASCATHHDQKRRDP